MNHVRTATVEDMGGLLELENSFPEDQRWGEGSWRDELSATNRHVLVWGESGHIDAAATFSLSDDVVDLHRIVTAADARRRGLARKLMETGILWARDKGASRMLLEVESSNVAAVSLYGALGFHRISERLGYYGPGAHAAILERELEGEPT